MKKLIALFMISIFLIQCNLITNPKKDNAIDDINLGKMSFTLDMTDAPDEVVGLIGTLTNSDEEIQFDFVMDENSATALVEELTPGSWNLQVDAFNSDSVIIYSGNTEVNVQAGTITTVSLQLDPVNGSLNIVVTWGDGVYLDSLLVAYYPFDNSLNDLSVYENNGVEYGGVEFAEGKFGQAVKFDGTYDYVEIAHQEQYSILEKTITFWFYKANDSIRVTPNLDDCEGLLYKAWDTGLERDFAVTIGGHNSPPFNLTPMLYDNSGSTLYLRIYDIIYSKQWYMVTIVMDQYQSALYLNGELARIEENRGELYLGDAPIIVGKCSYESISTRYFNGLIDDFAIYSKALSTEEIQYIYSNGIQ